jgi:hypothetical protein
MNAEEVRASLALRWPDSEYLHIAEAPEQADRGGRKLDVLVISLWRSRGLQLDGVEVKVSLSDWKRELANGAKADWWWRHVHRFWLAVPADLALKVQPDLPPTWGLLACPQEGPPTVVVKAPQHDAEPLGWAQCIGLMRAAADAGRSALSRAWQTGYDKGKAAGRDEAERRSPDGAAVTALTELRKRVETFERASGLKITGWCDDSERIGQAVAIVLKEYEYSTPSRGLSAAADAARRTAEQAERIATEARRVEKLAATLTDLLTPAMAQQGADQ